MTGSLATFTTTGLSRDFGGVGVFDVDLSIDRGSVYGLVGKNGAGKTTLLSMLAGLIAPDAGSIGLTSATVAMCPDVPEFEPWLTAAEVVVLSAKLTGAAAATRAAARGQALEFLTLVGLEAAADRRVGGFSRGMVQRLSLAAALVVGPDLLILDEPTSGLDPEGRRRTLDLIQDLRRESTVILSSHIIHDVETVCDGLGIMDRGRLILQGRTRDIVDAHVHPVWRVRLSHPEETRVLLSALRTEKWVTAVEEEGSRSLRVEAETVHHGAVGIPRVVARESCALTGLETVGADLESVLLSVSSGDAAAPLRADGAEALGDNPSRRAT
ncbi:ABC transporter ATP-binding protein [Streptomyces aureocirculatus]|uniref:ABC transporter ATP-binding protein n=1 Tax=Streptomyces aureocirculatus TaxID=67275 RepID=UPI0007C5CCCD|nr:ABC transporter ATP-binding protein [Streptomyces aureocirculatus]